MSRTTEAKRETSLVSLSAAFETPTGSKSSKKTVSVSYPLIEQAANLVEDEFWVDVLRKCARKKFPRSFIYNDNTVRYRTTGDTVILPDNPEGIKDTLIGFFQDKGKIYSSKDCNRRRVEDEKVSIAKITENNSRWAKVSLSKKRRSALIMEYVGRVYSHLNKSIRDELRTQIELGLDTKYLTNAHIAFENGIIVDINGIHADTDGLHFTREFKSLGGVSRTAVKEDKKHTHLGGWKLYVQSYLRYIEALLGSE